MDWSEIAGFVTGAVCVALVVRQHIANFAVGIANNVFFIVLFVRVGLYADAGLQVVYIALAIYGWWAWLRGGPQRSALHVTRSSPREWASLLVVGLLATAALTALLRSTTDSTVPFWDAVTTVLSLVATYQLSRKRLDSWFVWITADVLYVALYAYKHLLLTAVLYVGFLGLCVAGLVQWRRSMSVGVPPATVGVAA